MKKIVHIIHHTHWDLEWFFTIEDSTTILQHQIFNVIENIKKTDIPYLFDGQVGVFEKLSADTNIIQSISMLCKENKLFVGPWYSQPDLRLSSRESIIRNLEIGKSISKKYNSSFDILYTPDTFGFNYDISKLFINLNYKWAILWRGVDRKSISNSPIFKWGNSEKNIFVYNIASGYFVGRYLYDDEKFEEIYMSNIIPSIQYQSYNDTFENVAIPFGGDQMFFNTDLLKVVDKLNSKDDGCFYKISTWQDFLADFENEIKTKNIKIPLYEESLNKANGGRLHKTISSTRVDIKQLIYKLENKLVYILEPLYSILNTNMQYPLTLFHEAWKKLLLSQAHDSYGGCNSDEVNANIKNRLIRANNIVDANIGLALNSIGKNFKNKLIFVNPLNVSGSILFFAKVITDNKNFSLNCMGENIDFIVKKTEEIDGGVKVFYTSTGEIEKKLPSYYVHDVIVNLNKINEFSINEIEIVDSEKKSKNSAQNINIKNIKIKVMPDAGDSYDWSPISNKDEFVEITFKDFILEKTISMNGFCFQKYKIKKNIPKTLADWANKNNNFELNLIFEILTYKNEKIIDLIVQQATEDIRIDMSFQEMNSHNSCHWFESQMGLNQKDNIWEEIKNWKELKLRELPLPNDTFEGYIAFEENNKIKGFATNSTKEYFFIKNELTFVLLRTAKYLGRANFYSRPGRQGGLTDKLVLTEDAYKQMNNIKFSFYFFEAKNIIESFKKRLKWILFDNCSYHENNKYKYNTRIDIWNTPYIKTGDSLICPYTLESNKFIQSALYKTQKQTYILRLLNVSQNSEKLIIKFNSDFKVLRCSTTDPNIAANSFVEFEFIKTKY